MPKSFSTDGSFGYGVLLMRVQEWTIMKSTAIAAILLLTTNFASANLIQVTPRYFTASIESKEFAFAAAPRVSGLQRQSNWCWAACIQRTKSCSGFVEAGFTLRASNSKYWKPLADGDRITEAVFPRCGPGLMISEAWILFGIWLASTR